MWRTCAEAIIRLVEKRGEVGRERVRAFCNGTSLRLCNVQQSPFKCTSNKGSLHKQPIYLLSVTVLTCNSAEEHPELKERGNMGNVRANERKIVCVIALSIFFFPTMTLLKLKAMTVTGRGGGGGDGGEGGEGGGGGGRCEVWTRPKS